MKAIISFFCKPRKRDIEEGYGAIEIYKEVELQFIPPIGSFIKIDAGSDYIKVTDIHIDISESNNGVVLDIGLEEPEDWQKRSWSEMKANGWKIE